MLGRIRRAQARDRAWLARGELTGAELPESRAAGKTITDVMIELDASLVTSHSEKEDARGNSKERLRSSITRWGRGWSTGEALAMLLRPGNAGSNTAVDHLPVLDRALSQIPDRWPRRRS